MQRRTFMQRAGLSAAGMALGLNTGCDRVTPGQVADFALVGVSIAGTVIPLQHPALRVIRIVLQVAGKLVVTYLSYRDHQEQAQDIPLTTQQADDLKVQPMVNLVREDGALEPFRITEIQYG